MWFIINDLIGQSMPIINEFFKCNFIHTEQHIC